MKQRRPKLDFSGAPAAWSRDPGCAAVLNAGGVFAPAIEPYLNCVMAEAARRLDDRQEALKADIRLLIRQEGEHVRLHDAFNQALYAQGFRALEPLVDRLKHELGAQFEHDSFAFNLAWCVGFETFTLYLGQFVFGPGAHWLEGGDAHAVALWRWHLAEEYEHRSVCHHAYAALVGDYPLRLWPWPTRTAWWDDIGARRWASSAAIAVRRSAGPWRRTWLCACSPLCCRSTIRPGLAFAPGWPRRWRSIRNGLSFWRPQSKHAGARAGARPSAHLGLTQLLTRAKQSPRLLEQTLASDPSNYRSGRHRVIF